MSVSSGTEAESGIPERDSEEFATEVRGMFDRIAGVYDVMNSAMTAGLHHQWRQRAVDRANVGPM
jgi:demethylmenaquinone methyltransferase/2-methoxy-6-polyprenyl-1,4-benzoquinol methylase